MYDESQHSKKPGMTDVPKIDLGSNWGSHVHAGRETRLPPRDTFFGSLSRCCLFVGKTTPLL